MKLRARNGLLAVLAVALVVVSAGCPNSRSITAGIGTAQLSVTLTNPSRFDFGFFNVDRILVRPIDPGASQALGNRRDISVLPFGVFIDSGIATVDPSFLIPIKLSKGTYEVVEVRISSLSFFDQDFPTDPSTCESFQSAYDTSPTDPAISRNLAVPQQFTIVDGQDTLVALTFDMTKMMTAINNSFTCTPGCGAFCISNFDSDQLGAAILDYLSFN